MAASTAHFCCCCWGLFLGKSIPSWACCSFYWRVLFADHLLEKLLLIFLYHPREKSPLPWGHNTGVRKKSSRVIAIYRVPHTAFSYGVHTTETTEQSFTGMFSIMYIFYFTLWFSCCFYFCDITFSFLHQKPGTEGEADPNCQKYWEGFHRLRQKFATFFSIQFLIRKHITLPLPGLLSYISLDCASVHLLAQLILTALDTLTNSLNDLFSLGTDYFMPEIKRAFGLLC